MLGAAPAPVHSVRFRAPDAGDDQRARRDTNERNERAPMSKLLRGLAAGYGAKKLGGGCFSTVLIFLVLWWLLGHFGIFR